MRLCLTLQRIPSKLERVLRAIPDNQTGRFERQSHSRWASDANHWNCKLLQEASRSGSPNQAARMSRRGLGGLDLGLNPLALRSMLSCMGL